MRRQPLRETPESVAALAASFRHYWFFPTRAALVKKIFKSASHAWSGLVWAGTNTSLTWLKLGAQGVSAGLGIN